MTEPLRLPNGDLEMPPAVRDIEDVQLEKAMHEAKEAVLAAYGDDLTGKQAGHIALLVAEVLEPRVKVYVYGRLVKTLQGLGLPELANPILEAMGEYAKEVDGGEAQH